IHHYMGGSYYPIPCLILSTGKDRKAPQRYPDVLTTSWRISIRSMDSRTIDQLAGGKLCDLNTKESWALLENLALYDNESWNDPRDFARPVKAIALPQDVPTISHDEREELRKKGIKSPSKLLSLKYLSPASIKELNKNPSDPICVHFVNSIIILSTDDDTEEEDVLSTNVCDLNLDGMVKGKEGVKEQGKEEIEMETDMEVDEVIKENESEFETDEEVEEILKEEEDDEDGENFNLFPTMEELTHHEWLLKNP
ncbi:hypothetical protein Tco_0865906, partial [Tanacetum coccineum]